MISTVAATVAPATAPRLRELTVRALVAGVLFGALFGAANAYLGLRVGMTVSTSIPVAVMAAALFRLGGARGSVLEANLTQTVASASTALATGSIFTLPALYLWGLSPSYLRLVGIALLGGVLGISAMIPLRELLIVRAAAELPYPEGTACAEVLRSTAGDGRAGGVIFRGLFVGAALKLAVDLAGLMPRELSLMVPRLPGAAIGLELAPALLGVGYLLGVRAAGVLVSGSMVSALVLMPLFIASGGDPATVWQHQVRYVGAGAVALAALATVAATLPTMSRALGAVVSDLKRRGLGDRRRDVPGAVVLGGIGLVVVAIVALPDLVAPSLPLAPRLACAVGVALLGVIFVAVAARIVGLIGVSSQPTSGIALVTLLIVGAAFAAAGWTGAGAKAAVLTVGAVVAIAASKAGDISQDLKTGHLVGATPSKQQLGQYLGALTACWAVAATLLLLGRAYSFGSPMLPAPQATLMKTMIEGVLGGQLPWPLVGSGAALACAAMLAGVSGLSFAIGVYLPLATMTPILVGGVLRWIVERSRRDRVVVEADRGVLAASGLIAGEGLAGVAVALSVAVSGHGPRPWLSLPAGVTTALGVAGLLALCAWLVAAARTTPPR